MELMRFFVKHQRVLILSLQETNGPLNQICHETLNKTLKPFTQHYA
jgi:hypothetical protein